MAKKAVKEKYAGPKGPMKVKTPYPEEVETDEINSLGNKLADLSERVNETELSISDLTNKINRVMGRRGL